MLDPRSGVELFDVYGYGHANARSVDLIDPGRVAGTGIDVATIAANIYTNGSLGRLRLTGQLLDQMRLEHDGQVAILVVTDKMLAATGCEPDDMEGIVNLPLAAKDVLVVLLAKETGGCLRVSLRSKAGINVRNVAMSFGGGGHINAAGLTIEDPTPNALDAVIALVATAISGADK